MKTIDFLLNGQIWASSRIECGKTGKNHQIVGTGENGTESRDTLLIEAADFSHMQQMVRDLDGWKTFQVCGAGARQIGRSGRVAQELSHVWNAKKADSLSYANVGDELAAAYAWAHRKNGRVYQANGSVLTTTWNPQHVAGFLGVKVVADLVDCHGNRIALVDNQQIVAIHGHSWAQGYQVRIQTND